VTVSPGLPILAVLFLFAGMGSAETLATPRITCEVDETAATTTLTAKVKGWPEAAVFRINWKSGGETPAGFAVSGAKDGAITSSHRLGKTTLTRTILASTTADCILVHVIADQPGAVSFKAGYVTKNPTKIRNRREILLSGEKIQARAWVIPFEADVHDDGKGTIFLNGEGEALIILNLTDDPETSPISQTLARIGREHDPGHIPPSPHLIWEGVREGDGEKE
jgi:hypothetical protein